MSTLTPEQADALAIRDVSIALAAGAGCGKTFVLTERFLSHLDRSQLAGLEPARLDQLIAITFTDAAAREMRERIRLKCRQRLLAAESEEDEKYWLSLLRAIEAARVSTIHAFCASLLRASALDIGLDPSFQVLDQNETALLESQAIDDLLRERLAERDSDSMEVIAEFGLARVKKIVTIFIRRRHDPAFARWREASVEDVVAAWHACYEANALRFSVDRILEAAPVEEIIPLLRGVAPTKPKFVEARATLLALLPALVRGEVTEDDLEAIEAVSSVRGICNAKDWPNADDYGAYKDACGKLRTAIRDKCFPPFDPEGAAASAGLGLKLLRLAGAIVACYEAEKEARAALDFDDLLALAHRLLTDPRQEGVKEHLSEELNLLLVDEFQDTDQLQVDLVKTLCGEGFATGRLFFVGDTKQSIYRFRGAQPEVFENLRAEVSEAGRLPLSMNFRSQPAILAFVNALFRDAFDPYQALRANRPQISPEPCIEFLWTVTPRKNARGKGSKGAAHEARGAEARQLAARLRRIIDAGEPLVVDRGADRPRAARPGDIAILFRAFSDVQTYEEALREMDLPYYVVGGQAFYAQQEIFDVLNLLRAVASSADEISLAGVLRSPFFSLCDETLFWLVESGGSLNAALFAPALPEELPQDERAKAAAAAAVLRDLRNRKDAIPIADLLAEALARTGYDAALLAEFLGERKLANLQKLLEQARAADQSGRTELDGFITQLAEFVAAQPKEALAATSPEEEDVIRLMTIHQSKGLEFPVVALVDLDRHGNQDHVSAALDPIFGPLVGSPDGEEEDHAIGMRLYKALERIADREEATRLLYVATTRAADHLILSSSIEAYDAPKSQWMKFLAGRFDLETGEIRAALQESVDRPVIRPPDGTIEVDHERTTTSRRADLLRMLEEARKLAAAAPRSMPSEVAAIPVDDQARTHFSFSRISGQLRRGNAGADGDEAPAYRVTRLPGIDPPQKSPDAIRFGSLVHQVLERFDFRVDAAVRASELRRLCELLAPVHLPDFPSAAAEAERLIGRLLESQRGKKLAGAQRIFREVEFLLAWPPPSAGPPAPPNRPPAPAEGAARYFRGYIDCLYQHSRGDWHLVDYKTNAVSKSEIESAAKQYQAQLYVYALAIEQSLGRPPREVALYFLRAGDEFVLEWDDDARQGAILEVEDRIKQSLETTLEI